MDLCLPEESGVVFLCWTMRRDGGPPSIYHLISGHWAEAIRVALWHSVLACVDGIIFHCAVLCFVASTSTPLLHYVFDFGTLSRDFSVLEVSENQWNKQSVTVTAMLHAINLHNCVNRLYVVMWHVCWHATQQIITSTLTTTTQFLNEATEHEKGWSSRSSNEVE